MLSGRTIVILGAGAGGIVAAHQLRRYLPDSDRIILIDRSEGHSFAPSFLWVMIGERKPHDITRSLKDLNSKGIEFICDEIISIDPQEKLVRTKNNHFNADAIIVALGSEYDFGKIPGLKEGGQTFFTLEGSQAIANQIAHFQRGKILIVTASPQYKCPAAPYEAAMLIESFFRRRGIRKNVMIDFFAAEAAPMSTGGPAISAAICGMLEAKGIGYYPNHQLTSVNPQTYDVQFSNGHTIKYDLLFYVPPHNVSRILKETPLVSESGWIPVNPNTLETRFQDIYAIGDVNFIPLKNGKPLPKAGVIAHSEAEIVSYNLAQKWKGSEKRRTFQGEGFCFLEIGDHRAGLGKGYFYEDPPRMKLYQPNKFWHWGKVLFEKFWLWKWY